MRLIVAIAALAAIAGAIYLWGRQGADMTADMAADTPPPASGEMVAVTLPALSGNTLAGQVAFAQKCAVCHGANAGGLDGKGPPLIHRTYRPGHHADFAFVLAVRRGVQSHHWRFGNMPPVADVSEAAIANITAFVRAVQRENGVF